MKEVMKKSGNGVVAARSQRQTQPPELWQHQREAYEFIKDKPAALLAMDMGTGKTATVIRCLKDLKEGRVLVLCPKPVISVWEREIHQGVPRTKRHMKGSQASSTPATDGRYVVVMFGTVGMFAAYDMDGELLWKKDLGVLDNGSYYDSNDQWGHSSSPIIYGDTVILQIDRQKDSFVAAYDLATGRELWLTGRDGEISSWGTPTIVTTRAGGDELITNGTSIRGYDPKTGELRWTLAPNSDVAIPTPVAGPDFVYVAAGYPPVRPIYAIRPGSSGNISLEGRATSNF